MAILRQTMAKLFDSAVWVRFMQYYPIAFYDWPEAVNDVISGVIVEEVGVDVRENFRVSRSIVPAYGQQC